MVVAAHQAGQVSRRFIAVSGVARPLSAAPPMSSLALVKAAELAYTHCVGMPRLMPKRRTLCISGTLATSSSSASAVLKSCTAPS